MATSQLLQVGTARPARPTFCAHYSHLATEGQFRGSCLDESSSYTIIASTHFSKLRRLALGTSRCDISDLIKHQGFKDFTCYWEELPDDFPPIWEHIGMCKVKFADRSEAARAATELLTVKLKGRPLDVRPTGPVTVSALTNGNTGAVGPCCVRHRKP
ncbi:hypothetical protein NM208_g15610 [Fusarium decemcellulare]|uniref:Uncharacterized protein n=1 Tax=Fusarium decemcellulare TaxID=57161 RepID=A0ACC1RDS4_9HYPO|nr:hypothetical protein NM208_g15610 [Fusarium decemcellulare]